MAKKDLRETLIKTCPYCGGEAEVRVISTQNVLIKCANSDCPAKPTIVCLDKSDAVRRWNTRAND